MIDLCSLIPKLKDYICPILSTAYELQDVLGDFNMKSVQVSEAGMWQTCICENAETTQLHTENDCTYTVITVPEQEIIGSVQPDYTFIFKLKKEGGSVSIKLNPAVIFFLESI